MRSFDGHRHTGQLTGRLALLAGGVGGVGLAQGALGIDVEEGSDGTVDGGDAVEMGLGELA